jgi:flagellar biosynthesis protein FliQ
MMFARIIVGVVIGLAAGFFLSGKFSLEEKTLQIIQGFVGIVAIGFIAASFMFGAVFGVMAVAEIAVGYFAYTKLFQGSAAKP